MACWESSQVSKLLLAGNELSSNNVAGLCVLKISPKQISPKGPFGDCYFFDTNLAYCILLQVGCPANIQKFDLEADDRQKRPMTHSSTVPSSSSLHYSSHHIIDYFCRIKKHRAPL